jgi:hypothetical protein
MKLSEAIDVYIRRRRAVGAYLRSSESLLRSFLRYCGDVDLTRVGTLSITRFLNGRGGARPGTWRAKYSALKLFFAYWCLRGPLRRSPVPPRAPKRVQDFIPYIYSRAESGPSLCFFVRADHRQRRQRAPMPIVGGYREGT